MKRFLIFIGILVPVIVSEYVLVNELLTDRRPVIMLLSLFTTLLFIYFSIRFFKKYLLPGKHPNTQR
jgi:hypothetical protein